jgi:hypothetical protein
LVALRAGRTIASPGKENAMALQRTTFDWVSDYGQFYLTDAHAHQIEGIETVSDSDIERGFKQSATGIAIYTADSLKQKIVIEIASDAVASNSAPPPEAPLGTVTKVASAHLDVSSGVLMLFTPTHIDIVAAPRFAAPSPYLTVRIHWAEHPAARDDTADGAPPDVITVHIAPR